MSSRFPQDHQLQPNQPLQRAVQPVTDPNKGDKEREPEKANT